MPRSRSADENDEFDDDLPDDVYPDDEIPTVPCLLCRELILEDAERCPYCDNYISAEDAPARKSTWMWIGLIVALILAIMMAF
jgi:RNA polymerase subunit RPABC4/transcription elongation factor Spt4